MIDPLAEVVSLLQPGAPFSKVVNGAGRWRVRRSDTGQPFYCLLLEGTCRLSVDGLEPVILQQGDFVLIPAAFGFATSSLDATPEDDVVSSPLRLSNGEYGVGDRHQPVNVVMLVGHCVFGSPDAALLVSLLPQLVLVSGQKRLSTLVQLISDESRATRPAREVILERLLEVLLIEALRSTSGTSASPGLVRGIADERLAAALRKMHEYPTRSWTVAQLAKEASLSRSTFFERFREAVGLAPMAYLLAWRMALAKNLLSRQQAIAEVAERVGYSSASAFSVAFTRYAGVSPGAWVREGGAVKTAP